MVDSSNHDPRKRPDTIDMANESAAAKRRRAQEIARLLGEAYPEAGIQLRYRTPFELLVATILAAQCTDVRVNTVTPALFEHYPDPQAMARAEPEGLEKLIFSTGFYRNKARSILGMSRALVERHNGQVPGTMEELLELPGVGRKTANVILGHCFDQPGLVVDTHVRRISQLLGLAASDDPDVIEAELEKVLPRETWMIFSHLLAEHGRQVCVARRPRCGECVVASLCPSAMVA